MPQGRMPLEKPPSAAQTISHTTREGVFESTEWEAGRSRSRFECFREKKNLLSLPGIKPVTILCYPSSTISK
jgi:hypothetical protein